MPILIFVKQNFWLPYALNNSSTVLYCKLFDVLYENNFFSVFWDLYCASPEKRDTMEHSPEAKAFHDYVSFV